MEIDLFQKLSESEYLEIFAVCCKMNDWIGRLYDLQKRSEAFCFRNHILAFDL